MMKLAQNVPFGKSTDDKDKEDEKAKNNSDSTPKKKKRGFFRSCRLVAVLTSILIICGIFCALILSLSWFSGHSKKAVCGAVLENSDIYDELECSNVDDKVDTRVDEPDSDFPTNVSDDDAPVSNDIDVATVYEIANPSVVGVGIKGNTQQADQIIGSGFVVSENGLIATNQHVVSVEGAEYFVKFEGSEELVDVKNIYRDTVNDIAIIKVNKTGLKSLTLSNSDNLKPGQPVVAIGNPLGELSSTVTSGIISGLHREVNIGDSFLRTDTNKFDDTIQTDAAINPGNSGGPLLDANGHVIGINFATIQGYDNLSFAIPVNYLRQRIDQLREVGRFQIPYLGVEYRNRLVAVEDEVYVGAQILKIDPDGGAADTLKVGDVVIQFGDTLLEDDTLSSLIQQAKIGDKVDVIIIRANKKQTAKVSIVERAGE